MRKIKFFGCGLQDQARQLVGESWLYVIFVSRVVSIYSFQRKTYGLALSSLLCGSIFCLMVLLKGSFLEVSAGWLSAGFPCVIIRENQRERHCGYFVVLLLVISNTRRANLLAHSGSVILLYLFSMVFMIGSVYGSYLTFPFQAFVAVPGEASL